jgi:hypothetical protein
MKFIFTIQIILSLLGFLLAKNKIRGSHPDPSYNPIRDNWLSGPKIDVPIQYSAKHSKNLKALITHHKYKETTSKLQRKAMHRGTHGVNHSENHHTEGHY